MRDLADVAEAMKAEDASIETCLIPSLPSLIENSGLFPLNVV